MGLGQRRAQRRLAEHAGEVAGMTAREIDEVSLPDRLERRRVVALGDVAHQDRLHLGAEGREVLDPHLRPRAEGGLAVRRRRGRQDRDPRPRTADRLEQPAVELDHGSEELTGADECYGSGHRPQHRSGSR